MTHYDRKSKTWFTSLLFKQNPPTLGSNKLKALSILRKVETSTIKNKKVAQVNAAFNEFIEKGFAEEVFEDSEPEQVHYLPGHAVFKEDSTTNTRIVFNASATSDTGNTLNECLFQGPCLLPDIVQVLIRFRLNPIAFTLDISKMFLRIKLDHGKDYLRFFWRNCDQSQKPRIFRMTSVTFGVISSPFQAIDVVLKHADLFAQIYPLAAATVRDQLYMDDVPAGSKNFEEAKNTIGELLAFFMEANMKPHKFASNVPDILQAIPIESKSPETSVKVLGVIWDTKQDSLLLNLKNLSTASKQDTKRSFLEVAAKIFDPLGLFSPFTTKVKLLFQEVWKAESKVGKQPKSWDTALPIDIQENWDNLKNDIPNLKNISVKRCFFNDNEVPEKVDIFAFGDASKIAYATAIYVVGYHKNGQKTASLAFSRTRVTPLKLANSSDKSQTIVRLELLAALLAARAAHHVRSAIEHSVPVSKVDFFTDSMINLCRIHKGPQKFKLWVANRLESILQLSTAEQWHHCPGPINPADLPSRGLSAGELEQSSLWWKGPSFILDDRKTWPTGQEPKFSDDPERRKQSEEDMLDASIMLSATNDISQTNWEFVKSLVNRFDDWHKMIRFLSAIMRIVDRQHRKQFSKTPLSFSVSEKTAVETKLWHWSQQHHFKSDFISLENGNSISSKSGLAQFNPFFDKTQGLIKSNTRLVLSNLPESTRQAIVLPRDCPIVEKFVMHKHRMHQHAGSGYLHALMKENFILPQAKRQIRKFIRKCTKRGCVMPVPLEQQMAPLPANRTDDPAPFQSTAVDLFGPLLVFHRCGLQNCPHPKSNKVHCALFTCFQSRAVHLELVDSASTEDFLNAFRSFFARRGTPSTMYSDNAKGFKAASREIRLLYKSINWNSVKRKGQEKNIEWFFSTERSPHQNGLCERLVRTVKGPLRTAIGAASLTKAQLAIILTEIEAVVNNRPLATTSEDPSDLTPITPLELVCGRRLDQLPDPKNAKTSTSFSHLWRKRQAVLNQFWKRWHKDYLLEQSVRKKWKIPSHTDLMGRLVLIKDDHLSRNEWVIGRIVKILPSKDALIRNVVVKTPTSTLRRAVQKLALFEQF